MRQRQEVQNEYYLVICKSLFPLNQGSLVVERKLKASRDLFRYLNVTVAEQFTINFRLFPANHQNPTPYICFEANS